MSRHGSYRLTVSRSDKANSTKYWRGSHLIKEWPFVCSRPRVPPGPGVKKRNLREQANLFLFPLPSSCPL